MSNQQILDTSMSNRAFLFRRDTVLAVRRSPFNSNWVGKWELPGGKIEPDSALMPGAEILRELDEETGFDPLMQFLAILFFNDSNQSVDFLSPKTTHMSYFWQGRVTEGRLKLSEEHDEFKWCSLDQFNQLDLTPRVRVGFTELRDQLEAFAQAA